MCHGDFTDDFFKAAEHAALYERCLLEQARFRENAHFYQPPVDDALARMGRRVAAHVSAGLGLDNLELSYLGLKSPDIRQAVYKVAMKGPGRIICAGAAGLIAPGRGASESLHRELMGIVRDNPALDLVLAAPGIGAGETAMLVRRSLEHAFAGPDGMDEGPRERCAGLGDAGVVLVCSPDPGATDRAATDTAATGLSGVFSALSDASKAAYADGGTSGMAGYVHKVAASLEGFHAVEAGFLDFALPDVAEAAERLVDAGSTHIIASGLPSLLHRHPYSPAGPPAAVERLRRALPDTGIVYVKPDPEPIAGIIADILMARVVDAERCGMPLNGMLREL